MNQPIDSARGEDSRPAVFLDRDGTLIEDRGDLSDPAQVVFFRDTVAALCRLAEHFALFVVTNQSGVAKGAITIEDVKRVNDYVEEFLAAHGVPITATYVCPHERSSGCRCIKPNPYFLKEAERDFAIDLRRSFAIGDHPHDVELAARVGATGIYVLSGHGIKHRGELPVQTIVVDGIREAADLILAPGFTQRTSARTHTVHGARTPAEPRVTHSIRNERDMQYSTALPNDAAEIERLFIKTFSDSEGQAEGDMIGRLAGDLMSGTPEGDLYCFVAREDGRIVGCIVFSRITFESKLTAFILGPVAVQTDHQGQGIGQRLIRFGLDRLLSDGVELAITYGDPRFYSKVGFQSVTEEVIPAPRPLQHPEGWLAQSLKGQAIQPIKGKSSCVDALNKPEYW